MPKVFSEACERNKTVILETIRPLLLDKENLLEIGSGTGQHAVHFAENLPDITWQTSDRKENHSAINEWIDDSNSENLKRPIALDVVDDQWPITTFDAVFSANTVHIMSWKAVEAFFEGINGILEDKGLLVLYGPFNYKGKFTSESNRKFELWLKSIDLERGIRDFEAVNLLAEHANLTLLEDIEMPANNRILVWQKVT